MKKIFSNFLLIILALLGSSFLVSCNSKKLLLGKYYANNNTESYIEVLQDDKILFVNIDFTSWNISMEEEIPPETFGLEYYDLAKKFDGLPQDYDILQDSAGEGYDFIMHVEAYSNEDDTFGNSLLIYYSKSNKTLSCLDIIYTLKN